MSTTDPRTGYIYSRHTDVAQTVYITATYADESVEVRHYYGCDTSYAVHDFLVKTMHESGSYDLHISVVLWSDCG